MNDFVTLQNFDDLFHFCLMKGSEGKMKAKELLAKFGMAALGFSSITVAMSFDLVTNIIYPSI